MIFTDAAGNRQGINGTEDGYLGHQIAEVANNMRFFNSGRSVLTVTIKVQICNDGASRSTDGSVLTEGVVRITPCSNDNHLNLDDPYMAPLAAFENWLVDLVASSLI